VTTLALITRLTIDRTEAMPATFSWTKVVSATLVGRMWCHDLREDESAACPWVITLAPIPRLTIDGTEALPTTFSWTTVVSTTFVGRMWCHGLREDESAVCPWVNTLAPLTSLTVDGKETLRIRGG
jgi:uncharacterized protein YeaO (DUF488 family)